jgi:hypothetical protein
LHGQVTFSYSNYKLYAAIARVHHTNSTVNAYIVTYWQDISESNIYKTPYEFEQLESSKIP